MHGIRRFILRLQLLLLLAAGAVGCLIDSALCDPFRVGGFETPLIRRSLSDTPATFRDPFGIETHRDSGNNFLATGIRAREMLESPYHFSQRE